VQLKFIIKKLEKIKKIRENSKTLDIKNKKLEKIPKI
jgi:hypothetical protein